MFKVKILQTVVEQQSVDVEFFEGVQPGLHSILIHHDRDAPEIRGEHIWFVTRRRRVQQNALSVRNNSWRNLRPLRQKTLPQILFPAAIDAFVSTAQNCDPPSSFLERSGKFFDHRRLSCSADRQIADTDDQTAELPFFQDSFAIQIKTDLNDRRDKGTREAEAPSARAWRGNRASYRG